MLEFKDYLIREEGAIGAPNLDSFKRVINDRTYTYKDGVLIHYEKSYLAAFLSKVKNI
jgi:hypothetical protein